MTIRRAINIDANQIFGIETQCFSVPWTLNSIKADLKNPIAYYWVAVIDTKIVGYIGLWNVVGEGQITNVAVSPTARGQGVAQALINHMIQFACEKEMTEIMLEVRASNHVARYIYEKLGFKQLSVRKNYYTNPREDAINMKLIPN
ncbi:MAG: ribosomal-protein-alanine N-acetyltransferase [Epulopiscium sp. Nele67-Bin004]|nr:MAG: ribosomal-protein-alanine N-acetyltransferase [Epulopiscium sp. Nele67-Bin004]